MTKKVQLSFILAREIGYFDSYKALDILEKRVIRGEDVSYDEKREALLIPEKRVSKLCDYGATIEDLTSILEDWKTNPMSKKSCSDDIKWKMVVEQLQNLIDGKKEEEPALTLIKLNGYTMQKEINSILEKAREIIKQKKGFMTLYDATDTALRGLKELKELKK